ncbi:MAG: hypothetical protein MJZ25_11645 [Fibrobacter sp.]|nr:hypothetical protein [Fibrobacter sp.]
MFEILFVNFSHQTKKQEHVSYILEKKRGDLMNKSVLTILISSLFLLASCGNDNPASADNESSSSEVTRSSSSSTEQVNSSSAINNENISSSQIDEKYSSSSSDVSAESSSGGTVSTLPANYNAETGALTDSRNGKVYKTAKIGNQIWMAENLNFDIGDRPSACLNWASPCDERYDYYGKTQDCPKKSTENDCDMYGRLYSQAGFLLKFDNPEVYQKHPPVTESMRPFQGICPDGWHIPDLDEWQTLFNNSPLNDLLSEDAGGTNASGFNALILGYAANESNKNYQSGEDYNDEMTVFASVEEDYDGNILGVMFIKTRVKTYTVPPYNHIPVRCLMN